MGQAGYTDWIWVPYFRRCRVGDDRVEITPPIIFGRGFLFDGARQVVTIRRCLFGLTLSKEEVPFSDVITKLDWHSGRGKAALSEGGKLYYIVLALGHGEAFKTVKVLYELNSSERVTRILAAIRKLGV